MMLPMEKEQWAEPEELDPTPPQEENKANTSMCSMYSVLVLAASFLIQMLTSGVVFTYGVLLQPVQAHFSTSQTTAAWLGSIQMFVVFIAALFTDRLVKKFGVGLVTVFASLLSVLGLVLSALPHNIYLMYFTYSVMAGTGMGVIHCVSILVVQQHFSKHLAMANRFLTSGFAVGVLAFSPINEKLVRSVDFNIFYVLGAIFALSLMAAPIYHYARKYIDEPTGYNEGEIETERLNEVWASGQLNNYSQLDKHQYTTSNERIIRVSFILILCSFTFFVVSTGTLVVYLPSRGQEVSGISSSEASLLLTYFGVADLVSRLFLSWIADVVFSAALFIAAGSIILLGLLTLVFFLWNTHALLITYAIMFGGVSGYVAGLFLSTTTRILGVVASLTKIGCILAATGLGSLISSPFVAFLNEQRGDEDAAFIFCGCLLALSGLSFGGVACLWKFKIYKHNFLPE